MYPSKQIRDPVGPAPEARAGSGSVTLLELLSRIRLLHEEQHKRGTGHFYHEKTGMVFISRGYSSASVRPQTALPKADSLWLHCLSLESPPLWRFDGWLWLFWKPPEFPRRSPPPKL